MSLGQFGPFKALRSELALEGLRPCSSLACPFGVRSVEQFFKCQGLDDDLQTCCKACTGGEATNARRRRRRGRRRVVVRAARRGRRRRRRVFVSERDPKELVRVPAVTLAAGIAERNEDEQHHNCAERDEAPLEPLRKCLLDRVLQALDLVVGLDRAPPPPPLASGEQRARLVDAG